jgi:hypothetical protein
MTKTMIETAPFASQCRVEPFWRSPGALHREQRVTCRLGDLPADVVALLKEHGLADWLAGADDNDKIDLGWPTITMPCGTDGVIREKYSPPAQVPLAEVVARTQRWENHAECQVREKERAEVLAWERAEKQQAEAKRLAAYAEAEKRKDEAERMLHPSYRLKKMERELKERLAALEAQAQAQARSPPGPATS